MVIRIAKENKSRQERIEKQTAHFLGYCHEKIEGIAKMNKKI